MNMKRITPSLYVAPQPSEAEIGIAASRGIRAVINNRPAGESDDQPDPAVLAAAAERHGLEYRHMPVIPGQISNADVVEFRQLLAELRGPVLAFCRTGTRCTTLWALSEAPQLDVEAILSTTAEIGYDLENLRPRLEELAATGATPSAASAPARQRSARRHDVVVVGGGAGGLAAASSILKRRPGLDVVVVEPREHHYYQPGWTLVGGGVFDRRRTQRPMADVMPAGVNWLRAAVAAFEPEHNQIVLEDGERIGYRALVVAPGLKLEWDRVEGLKDSLGHHGVTSNYLFDMAAYTWELVQGLRGGRAVFTQPPMPIKCAGAPQKAMYLSCDHWRRSNRLAEIDVAFYTAGPAVFGVPDFVPALSGYVERYGADVNFGHNLVAVDGPARKAWFERAGDEGASRVEVEFDLLHACPPQGAPDFIKSSPLADADGWVDVTPGTLQHSRYGSVFGLGDGCSAPNAKTAAAVRAQAPVVANNVLSVLDGDAPRSVYEGYGACPLTVERGKVVLAEFGYGGKLMPTLPRWLINGTRPSRLGWLLKEKLMPPIYWELLLKGREWLVETTTLPVAPAAHDALPACDPGAASADTAGSRRTSNAA